MELVGARPMTPVGLSHGILIPGEHSPYRPSVIFKGTKEYPDAPSMTSTTGLQAQHVLIVSIMSTTITTELTRRAASELKVNWLQVLTTAWDCCSMKS